MIAKRARCCHVVTGAIAATAFLMAAPLTTSLAFVPRYHSSTLLRHHGHNSVMQLHLHHRLPWSRCCSRYIFQTVMRRRIQAPITITTFTTITSAATVYGSLDQNKFGWISSRLCFASSSSGVTGDDDEKAALSQSLDYERPNNNNINDNASNKNDPSRVLRQVEQSLCEILQHVDHHHEGNDAPIILLLGLSGGCDSVGLLHALVQIMSSSSSISSSISTILPESRQLVLEKDNNNNKSNINNNPRSSRCVYQVELHAVHFDHQQRGDESDGDRFFVQDLCERLGVPLHTYYWEGDRDSFSQDIARTWRQTTMSALLQSLVLVSSNYNPHQQQQRGGVILTAHHKDDSMESLLLKLLRGVHITNLSGMEPYIKMKNDVWGRPMLGLSKVDIQTFLESQQITWREDSSNLSSDKYKRNRVRNELIPLMADIVGGEAQLAKRLDHLMEQSAELNADLNVRASIYLKMHVLEDGSFVLPNDGHRSTLNLVEKEALHKWATTTPQRMATLSYDQLERICHQLHEYPTSQQWTLQVGSGWNVIRNGKALHVQRQDDVDLTGRNALLDDPMLTWVNIGTDGSSIDDNDDDLVIRIPSSADLQFSLSTAGKASRWLYTPSWRVEHRPIKLKDFLRGQKIPLHLREHIPIIYVSGTSTLVAVQVDDSNKWILDAAFDPAVGGGDFDRVRLILPI